jgi:hypothetical protein
MNMVDLFLINVKMYFLYIYLVEILSNVAGHVSLFAKKTMFSQFEISGMSSEILAYRYSVLLKFNPLLI